MAAPAGTTNDLPSSLVKGVRAKMAATLPMLLTICRSMTSAMVTLSAASPPLPMTNEKEPSLAAVAW
jgi:hypothetical protein